MLVYHRRGKEIEAFGALVRSKLCSCWAGKLKQNTPCFKFATFPVGASLKGADLHRTRRDDRDHRGTEFMVAFHGRPAAGATHAVITCNLT